MQIKLENIGIVKNSSIELNGLTVITGKNNSGKSTVGKTLYALLDAVSNISEKYEKDRCNFIKTNLDNIKYSKQIFRVWVRGQVKSIDNLFSIDSYFKKFAYNEYRKLTSSSELEEFVKGLLQEMIRFKPNTQQRDAEVGNKYVSAGNKKNEKDELVMTVSELEDLLETIKRDPQQIVYTKESINQTLRKEFARQVQPIRGQNGSSVISLTDGDKVYFSLTIENNNVVDDTKTKFMAGQYKKVY